MAERTATYLNVTRDQLQRIQQALLASGVQISSAPGSSLLGRLTRCGAEYQDLAATTRDQQVFNAVRPGARRMSLQA
jgi:hypothetical protein